MVKGLDRKIARLERQQASIGNKIEKLKMRHAHDLMNEARSILGKPKKSFGGRKTRRARTSTKTTAAKKANGGATEKKD